MSDEKIVKTICLLCPPGCGIDVYVKDNKPVKIEGMPESVVGPICIKGELIPEWYETELKNRILHPLQKTGTGWKEITWDKALTIMADKFNDIKKKYGPEALSVYIGQVESDRDFGYPARRFCIGYGTPSYYSACSFCYFAKTIAGQLTFGDYAPPTLVGTKCVVVWAANPTGSVPFAADVMLMMKTQGKAKMIVIDPRRTLLAKAADLHLQLRPGTDGALALGFLNVIISEKLYDEAFVNKWTVGFDKLVELVKQYTPEKVEQITWVPADKVIAAARMYAASKPATIFQGNCLDTVDNGFYGCRAIDTLIAVSGNLDVRGGSTLMPFVIFSKMALEGIAKEELPKVRGAGEKEWPLFFEGAGQPNFTACVDAILTEKPYPIKAMIIQAGNPVITWSHTNKLKKALDKLDFLVVMDLYMTETAEMADLVLPAATTLEQQQIYQYVGRPMIILMNEAIKPPADCWPDWKLWVELGKRMGYHKYLPWNSIDELESEILANEPLKTTLEQMRANPGGYFFTTRSWKKYDTVPGWKFATPSGKVEIYSERLKQLGYNPLPDYVEPAESPVSRPDLAKDYPLVLSTGVRSLYYLHSMNRGVPSLRARDPEPMAELNTETARKLGIESGDTIIIESPRGAVQMKAAVTRDIHPLVVSLPHAWGGLANQNLLTSDNADPVWGGPAMRALLCRVRKAPITQAPKVILE